MRKRNLTAVLRFLSVLSPAVLQGTTVMAQGEWDEATRGINSLYNSMGNLLMVVMGIGALIVLVMIIFNVMKGDKESAHKLFWWLLGLAFGFVMMAFLKGLSF